MTLLILTLIITNIGTITLGYAFWKQKKDIEIMLYNIASMQNTISNGLKEIRKIQENENKQSKQFN